MFLLRILVAKTLEEAREVETAGLHPCTPQRKPFLISLVSNQLSKRYSDFAWGPDGFTEITSAFEVKGHPRGPNMCRAFLCVPYGNVSYPLCMYYLLLLTPPLQFRGRDYLG